MTAQRIVTLNTHLVHPAPYYLGEGMAANFPAYIQGHGADRLFLITSASLDQRFGRPLGDELRQAGLAVTTLHIDEGEPNKSWQTLTSLCDRLLAVGATRTSLLIGLGGGLIGNIVGMAAGLIYRGIRFVQVPTTLMAQTDSVLSNKQAINGPQGKNQFGLYHAPLFIWSDLSYTFNEPLRQIKAAIVEGIKNGLIHDPGWLDKLAGMLRQGTPWLLSNLAVLAEGLVRSKLEILQRDPTEKQYAVILEYGHTFGHALEFLSHGALLHGEAIAIGMCVAARLSYILGMTSAEVVKLHHYVLGELLQVPTAVPAEFAPELIYEAMRSDNKRIGSEPRFLLLERPGTLHNPHEDYLTAVPREQVLRALAEAQRP